MQNILILSLLIGLLNQNMKINNLVTNQNKAIKQSNSFDQQIRNDNLQNNLQDEIIHRQKLKERDYKVINDPLTPGEKRLPAHQYPRGLFKQRTNIPTRGQPENYQYLGNLIRDTDDKILPVFGRQEYPGSDYYEYYLMLNQDGNFGLKLPLFDGKRKRELEEDQIVEIDYFKSKEGNFKFKPFDYDVPRYNPYDY